MEEMLNQNNYLVFDEKENLTNIYFSRVILKPENCLQKYDNTKPNNKNSIRKAIVLFRLKRYEESRRILKKMIQLKNVPDDIMFDCYFYSAHC